jgi:hypothetical protein
MLLNKFFSNSFLVRAARIRNDFFRIRQKVSDSAGTGSGSEFTTLVPMKIRTRSDIERQKVKSGKKKYILVWFCRSIRVNTEFTIGPVEVESRTSSFEIKEEPGTGT